MTKFYLHKQIVLSVKRSQRAERFIRDNAHSDIQKLIAAGVSNAMIIVQCENKFIRQVLKRFECDALGRIAGE